jgi:hypothetical protein
MLYQAEPYYFFPRANPEQTTISLEKAILVTAKTVAQWCEWMEAEKCLGTSRVTPQSLFDTANIVRDPAPPGFIRLFFARLGLQVESCRCYSPKEWEGKQKGKVKYLPQ